MDGSPPVAANQLPLQNWKHLGKGFLSGCVSQGALGTAEPHYWEALCGWSFFTQLSFFLWAVQTEAELLWEDQECNETAGQAGKGVVGVAEGGRWGPAVRGGRKERR